MSSSRFNDYVDWAVRGLVAGLCAGGLSGLSWAITVDTRIHDLQAIGAANAKNIQSLEEQEATAINVRVDLAVLQTQQADHSKKLDRIEALVSKLVEKR